MFDRFSIARKAYHILISARKTIAGFAGIGLVADVDCHISTIEDVAFQLLIELFPEVDESFFTLFFFEATEIDTEEAFLRALKEELTSTKTEFADKDEENKRAKTHVVTIKYTPSPDEIDRALRKLFGM